MCFEHSFILYSLPPFTATLSQASLLPSQLASNYSRSLGDSSGTGLPTRVNSYSPSERCPLSTDQPPSFSKEVQKLLTKGAIVEVEPHPDQFISRLFLVTKKDAPSGELETT